MTLGEGKKKVYMLIDEYSSGGAVTEDEDIEAKMAAFFDIAQKDVAKRQKIIKSVVLPYKDENGKDSWKLPKEFIAPYRLWLNCKQSRRSYIIKSGEVMPVGDEQTLEIEYYSYPNTIDGNTPDDYEFEVKEDGAQAMVFYVAAQQLCVDLVNDNSFLYQEYLRHYQSLDETEGTGIQNRIANTLWR